MQIHNNGDVCFCKSQLPVLVNPERASRLSTIARANTLRNADPLPSAQVSPLSVTTEIFPTVCCQPPFPVNLHSYSFHFFP